MESVWLEYQCKAGQTSFLYNKVTGEHKWVVEGVELRTMLGRPVDYKEYRTAATQTDDNGCNNGCMSMYINTDQSLVSSMSNTAHLPQQKIGMSNEDRHLVSLPGLKNNSSECEANANNIVNSESNNGSDTDTMSDYDGIASDYDDGYDDNLCSDIHDQDIRENDSGLNVVHEFQQDIVCDTDDANGDDCTNMPVDIGIQEEEREQNDILQVLSILEETASSLDNSQCNNDNLIINNEIEQHKNNTLEQHNDDATISRKVSKEKVKDKKQRLRKNVKKIFECEHCSKNFDHRGRYNRHLRVHTGEKPYECSVCKRCFAETNTLQQHMRVHTGEKPFECSYCKKKFSHRGHFKVHVMIHTGEHPFKCVHCEKGFGSSQNLEQHIKTHTGEKAFECVVCKKKFIDKYKLKRHTIVHMRLQHFECPYCIKVLKSKKFLEKHVKAVHKKEKS